ncbi:SUMF1/EgtB/PvdO family nonheme iron enzyme [candidate division KSB1 bacterium]|nr:SUMF1/EgtB/PvdO family nonheme iron enzyme [candidate division KSB1 bacterium]
MKQNAGLFVLLIFICLSLCLITDSNSQPRTPALRAADSTETPSIIGQENEISLMEWIKKNPELVGFAGLILAAVITGIFTILTRLIKTQKRLSEAQIRENAYTKKLAELEADDAHKKNQSQKKLETEEDRYLDFVIQENEKLTFQGFETKVRVPILLWDIYVPLRVNIMGMGRMDERILDDESLHDRGDMSVQQAVQLAADKKYDGLIVLGDPGAGKTTLLKYFLLCFAQKEAAQKLNLPPDLLPILLPLRNIDTDKGLIDAICHHLRDYDLKLSEAFFKDRLEHGRAIILLDGLDEVADEQARKQMCQWIHKKVRMPYGKCPLIVTSRFTGYRGDVRLPGAYMELHMRDFATDDIRNFLHSWYRAVETTLNEDSNYWRTKAQESANALYKRINVSDTYLALAANPLLLQLIALVHRDYNTVPDRRVELYDKCTDLLLQKWDEAKGLKSLLTAAEARQVLQPLALWLHSVDNRRQETEAEILKQITPEIHKVKPAVDPTDFLRSIRDRSGIFVGYSTETYGFQHLSFQEYLTAEQIRNTGRIDILVDHFDESWWREPTLLTLGLSNPSMFEPFMTQFLSSEKIDRAVTDFLPRCIHESLIKSEKPFQTVLENLTLPWQQRFAALRCLQIIGTDAAQKIVAGLIDDVQPQVRDWARSLLVQWEFIASSVFDEELEPVTGLPRLFTNPYEGHTEYILIPPGAFTMGESRKQVTIEQPFYLAKFIVTNKLYRAFVKATNHREPRYWDDKKYNSDDQPVVGVAWDDAVAYCDWLTKQDKANRAFRLPTEAEWEWAAGRGEREYPWGNAEPTPQLANFDMKVGQPTPVGSYPEGATPDGLMDIAGNVWEWSADWYDEKEKTRVVRGAAFFDDAYGLRCASRLRGHPINGYYWLGFRVALSPVYK